MRETFAEYLRRVGKDHQASSEANGTACSSEPSPTAEDYQRAADTIVELKRAIDGMVHAFGLDDRSMFTVEQRKALRQCERLQKARVMGKVIA